MTMICTYIHKAPLVMMKCGTPSCMPPAFSVTVLKRCNCRDCECIAAMAEHAEVIVHSGHAQLTAGCNAETLVRSEPTQIDAECKQHPPQSAMHAPLAAESKELQPSDMICIEQDSSDSLASLRQQLEVAERKCLNAIFVREAAEAQAAEALSLQAAAEARAAESTRLLQRALDKIASLELRDKAASLTLKCMQTEARINYLEDDIRLLSSNPDLQFPLHTADRRALAKAERALVRERAQFNSQSELLSHVTRTLNSHERLRTAASAGDVAALLDALREGANVNAPDSTGFSALQYACGSGNAAAVKLCLDRGGDVRDGSGTMTPLIIAVSKVSLLVVLCDCALLAYTM
jgi:Ankyrin repeats (3 copies)